MQRTLELADWEYRLTLRLLQLAREPKRPRVIVDLARRTLEVCDRPEYLDQAPQTTASIPHA